MDMHVASDYHSFKTHSGPVDPYAGALGLVQQFFFVDRLICGNQRQDINGVLFLLLYSKRLVMLFNLRVTLRPYLLALFTSCSPRRALGIFPGLAAGLLACRPMDDPMAIYTYHLAPGNFFRGCLPAVLCQVVQPLSVPGAVLGVMVFHYIARECAATPRAGFVFAGLVVALRLGCVHDEPFLFGFYTVIYKTLP